MRSHREHETSSSRPWAVQADASGATRAPTRKVAPQLSPQAQVWQKLLRRRHKPVACKRRSARVGGAFAGAAPALRRLRSERAAARINRLTDIPAVDVHAQIMHAWHPAHCLRLTWAAHEQLTLRRRSSIRQFVRALFHRHNHFCGAAFTGARCVCACHAARWRLQQAAPRLRPQARPRLPPPTQQSASSPDAPADAWAAGAQAAHTFRVRSIGQAERWAHQSRWICYPTYGGETTPVGGEGGRGGPRQVTITREERTA